MGSCCTTTTQTLSCARSTEQHFRVTHKQILVHTFFNYCIIQPMYYSIHANTMQTSIIKPTNSIISDASNINGNMDPEALHLLWQRVVEGADVRKRGHHQMCKDWQLTESNRNTSRVPRDTGMDSAFGLHRSEWHQVPAADSNEVHMKYTGTRAALIMALPVNVSISIWWGFFCLFVFVFPLQCILHRGRHFFKLC